MKKPLRARGCRSTATTDLPEQTISYYSHHSLSSSKVFRQVSAFAHRSDSWICGLSDDNCSIMGNKCFKAGRDSDLDIAGDIGGTPAGFSMPTVKVISDGGGNARNVDPQRAVNEFHQILQDKQNENLVAMRDQLKKKPEQFVLNNLVMAVQFFEDFDRDKDHMCSRKSEQESNVNNAIDDVRCRCQFAGSLAENVGRRYRFQAKGASLPEVVTSLRYNIAYNNMEVYPKEQYASLAAREYSSLDDANYRFCMEDCDNTPGWVMLRCVDFPSDQSTSGGAESLTYDRIDVDSDCYSKYSDYESVKSISGKRDSTPSVRSATKNAMYNSHDASIATRERMKTPDHSSTSQSDEENDDIYPVTGADFMQQLENKIKGNGKLASTVPLSDSFGKPSPNQPAVVANHLTVPRTVAKKHGRRHHEGSSDDDYDYSSINCLPRQLPKPSGMTSDDSGVSSRPRRPSAVPLNCFKTVKIKIVDTVDNPLRLGAQHEIKTYFSSAEFFDYFSEGFYDWSQRLDRNGQSLQEASVFKAAVCCDEIKATPERKYRTKLEFTPVVHVNFWPDVASEWQQRKRPVVVDKRTSIRYRWPRPSQIDGIVGHGCELTTDGARNRGRKSKHTKLEWELCFNSAHETLLMSLSEHHLQALLWARLIFRYVLEPIGVLSYQHLETVFFYMIEENYLNWQASSLGEQIKAIFERLYACTSKRRLPHYFIHKRNMLQTKASRDLFKAQERTFRLNEGFLKMTMQAVRLVQTSDSAYPVPDFARLWEIITTPLSLDAINPAIQRPVSMANIPAEAGERKKKGKPQQQDGFWETVKQQSTPDKTQAILRQERARLEAEERERRSASTGDLTERDVTIGPFNESQTKCLLVFFIEHFITVAKIANRRRNYDRSNVVLAQAANLATLLKEEGYIDQGEQYLNDIDDLKLAARNTVFRDPYVNIPGSPSVFKTGISEHSSALFGNGLHHSSSPSSSTYSISKAGTPLPETPVEKEARKNLANGHSFYHAEVLNKPNDIPKWETATEKPSYLQPNIMITTAEVSPSIPSPPASPAGNWNIRTETVNPVSVDASPSSSDSVESESDFEATDF